MSDVIAFTGTRRGLSRSQYQALVEVLSAFPGAPVHNGAAHGADRECLAALTKLGPRNVHYWPSNESQREYAFRWGTDFERHPLGAKFNPMLPPLDRNRRMVEAATVVVACPQGYAEELRSGTWATVRHARRLGRRLVIVWPDGQVTREGEP